MYVDMCMYEPQEGVGGGGGGGGLEMGRSIFYSKCVWSNCSANQI